MKTNLFVIWSVSIIVFFFLVPEVLAHCDTMDGPVVQAAQKALETGNIDLVLIWVQQKYEGIIKEAFERTLAVRKLNAQAKELADMYFFETLVRLHRAGEGEPYTGLKPAGSGLSPATESADRALETGKIDPVIQLIGNNIKSGIGERFHKVMELKKEIGKSIEAGRAYVATYVEYVHYIERLHLDAESQGESHEKNEGQHQE
ncbi:MAG: DUF6448 family protein [Bacteroidota bacterium]